MNYTGLIYDRSFHYIDHLAPFCSLMNFPLIVCESEVATLVKKYYPNLQVIEEDVLQLKLPSTIVTCETAPMIRAAFPGQTATTLWLPHGNSDKGWNGPFFEALQNQTAFVYGQKMVDFMKAKNVFPKTIQMGNFRWDYFKKHQQFYKPLMDRILPNSGINFLYAPTWDDAEGNCSFWEAFTHLTANVPNHCNLLIKLHPNTTFKFADKIERLKGQIENKKNILFLPELPPIYPLLHRCDAYIGDMSSIGYDFLKFDRPMFFLNSNQKLALHRCGTAIEPTSFNFSIKETYSTHRRELYNYTFGLSILTTVV